MQNDKEIGYLQECVTILKKLIYEKKKEKELYNKYNSILKKNITLCNEILKYY